MTRERVYISFAGFGGSCEGARQALGRSPDVAINHWPVALSVHAVNHPETIHLPEDVWQVNLPAVVGKQPVGMLWASPDCTHHSRARGGAPLDSGRRGLADVLLRWASEVRPRVIFLENVEEFADWGPLDDTGRPCRAHKGQSFKAWVAGLEAEGYAVEWRTLRACDYGAPTIRKRLYLIARRDGEPIVWPAPTHGRSLLPYRTAAECIDWSLPCPSIFLSREEGRKVGVNRPLAPATMARIAKGVQRYVVDAERPFIVPTSTGIAAGFMAYAQQGGAVRRADAPMHTITASRKDCNTVVMAFLAQHNAGPRPGRAARGLTEPLSTITATGSQQALVAAFLTKFQENGCGTGLDEPLHTVMAGAPRHGLVASFLVKYYGSGDPSQACDAPLHTIPSRDRFGLVQVHGEPYRIVDIGMRMLTPRELLACQGFPADYIIERGAKGEKISKKDQVALIGNSVCPPVARALIEANYQPASIQAPALRRPAALPLFEAAA